MLCSPSKMGLDSGEAVMALIPPEERLCLRPSSRAFLSCVVSDIPFLTR